MKNSHGWRRRAVVWHVCATVRRAHTSRQRTAGRMRHPGYSTLRFAEGVRPEAHQSGAEEAGLKAVGAHCNDVGRGDGGSRFVQFHLHPNKDRI